MNPQPSLRCTMVAIALALAGSLPAQAAGLAITGGSVAGSHDVSTLANGQASRIDAALVDASGTGLLRATGSLTDATTLSDASHTATVDRLWTASASLDVRDPLAATFQIGATSALTLGGSGQLEGGVDLTSLLLQADLAVTSTGEAAGTPVRLLFRGSAESRVDTSGPALDLLPSFDLVLRDAQGGILASWQGLATGSRADFDFWFDSQVGEALSLSLSHDSTGLLGESAALAAGGHQLGSSALLSGSLQVTAVPEPEPTALLLAGLAALGLMRSRHNQHRR